MPIKGMCPYYRYEKAGVTYCACGSFHFPDREARRAVVYAYCAHPTNFAKCPFKCAMDDFYERSLV